MRIQTPPFTNGDIVIFNADKWNAEYHDASEVYRVKVIDFNPEDSETFIGVVIDGPDEGEKSDGFYTSYFEKVSKVETK